MGAGAAAVALDACTPDVAKKAGKASTSNKDLHGEMLQNYPGIGVLGYGCMRWPQKRNEQGRNVIDQEEVVVSRRKRALSARFSSGEGSGLRFRKAGRTRFR